LPREPCLPQHMILQLGQPTKVAVIPIQRHIWIKICQKIPQHRRLRQREAHDRFGSRLRCLQQIFEQPVYLDFHPRPPFVLTMEPQLRLKGKPIRLAVLDYGLFQVHANGRVIGICGYVIKTDADEVILIDTGFPEKYARDAQAATQEDALGSFGRVLSVTPDNMPAAQLAKLGLAPADVTLMIQSHTHIDHVGHMDLCPQAPILIASAERALPRPMYWSGKQPLDWPKADFITIDSDMKLVSRASEVDEGFAGSWDVPLAIHHGARLLELAQARSAMVIYGHSPEQWPDLPKAPEWFT